MAAFNPKPWFKQPAGTVIKLTEKPQPYVKMFEDEDIQDPVDIPKAFVMFGDSIDESKNYANISVSYELFNDLIIWGMITYPELHTFFMENTEIHGSKGSFNKDVFKPLTSSEQFLKFKDIKKGSPVYKRLTMSQKYISNLIQDYDKFAHTIKDKLTSICKTKMFDRYGNYSVNFAIINYPGVNDIYEKEEVLLLKGKRMPFGKFKGKLINDMEDQYMKDFMNMKSFKHNKQVRQAFRKTKFRVLMKDEAYYKDMNVPTKARTSGRTRLRSKVATQGSKSSKSSKGGKGSKSSKGSKGSLRKKKQTRRKGKRSLYYFYMDNCHYCDKFNPIWTKLVKEFKSKLTMKKINGPSNEKIAEKYDVSVFPTIILVNGLMDPKKYKGDNNYKGLKSFIN